MVGQQRRVTIRDVAAACGLALSTVSNALAGKPHVKPETRKLVHEAAQRLGYRASTVARALRMQRSFTIGVLVADVANPVSPAFVRGIEDVALKENCTLFVCNTDDVEDKQITYTRALIDRQVDGVVLISQYCNSPAIQELIDSRTPFVFVQRRSTIFKADYVGSDNLGGVMAAVEHLVALGHRRIGLVRGPQASSTAQERVDAFREATRIHRLDPDPELIYQGDYEFESGYEACMAFLSWARPPTAILASNDLNALGILEAAMVREVAVPGRLSVVGCDDIPLSALRRIGLTTIHLPKRDMGAAAAKLLMRRIKSRRDLPPKEEIFPTRLVVRASTAKAPAGAAAMRRRKAS